MEFLKELATDWILFSLIESWITVLIFVKLGKFKEFKIYEIIIISIFNCMISNVFSPLIYQIIQILFLEIYVYHTKKHCNILYILKNILFMMFIFLLTETVLVVIYNMLFKIDFIDLNKVQTFAYLIPSRVSQLIIIKFGGNFMKYWWGGVKR